MPKKILIIEDEVMLSEMYEKKFKDAGYNAISTGDAENALSLIKKEKPNLILLDILLPKKSGLEILEQIKKDEKLAKIKIVAFSNFDNPETKKRARKLKVEAYLIKTNYTPKQVVERVKKFIE